jgi:hypothetical protein
MPFWKRTFPVALLAWPQASITKGSLTATQTISSTPLALMSSAADTNPGRNISKYDNLNSNNIFVVTWVQLYARLC